MKIFDVKEVLRDTKLQFISDGIRTTYVENETMYRNVVLGLRDFEDFLTKHNITNTEDVEDCAFISIVDKMPFLKDNSNTISLGFLDMAADLVLEDGTELFTISAKQADRLVAFIDKNFYKNFIIHCGAGVSRSQQVSRYIELLGNHYYDAELSTKPLVWCHQLVVLRRLLQAHERFHWWWGSHKDDVKYDAENDRWYCVGGKGEYNDGNTGKDSSFRV